MDSAVQTARRPKAARVRPPQARRAGGAWRIAEATRPVPTSVTPTSAQVWRPSAVPPWAPRARATIPAATRVPRARPPPARSAATRRTVKRGAGLGAAAREDTAQAGEVGQGGEPAAGDPRERGHGGHDEDDEGDEDRRGQ